MRNPLPSIPDPRPSHAHPEHRARRKSLEAKHGGFAMSELGTKVAVMAVVAGLALFPWEKEVEKHEKRSFPERFEGRDRDGRREERRDRERRDGGNERRERCGFEKIERGGRDDGIRRDRGNDHERRRRRRSEGGERSREYRRYMDRDREYHDIIAVEEADEVRCVDRGVERGSERGVQGRRYTGSEDGECGRRYIEATRAMERNKERAGEMRGVRGVRGGEYEGVERRERDRRQSDR